MMSALPSIGSRAAVFLDRDGVLNRSLVIDGKPYAPSSWDQFEVMEGAAEACRRLKAAGFVLVYVTNQPDVGRGATDIALVERINDAIRRQLGVDDFRVCIHQEADGCGCRKPKPGMLLDAAAAWSINPAASFMVGDRWRDIDAGAAAGCRTVFLDYGYRERQPERPDFVCGSLTGAVDWILRQTDPL